MSDDDASRSRKRSTRSGRLRIYSNMPLLEAEDRLGLRMQTIKTMSAKDMLIKADYILGEIRF